MNGNLWTADVVILALNPNFDRVAQANWVRANPEAARILAASEKRNIKQSHEAGDCPFYDLDTRLVSHPGALYWRSGFKFKSIASELTREWDVSLDDVYREIASRVAVLQLLPYRSRKFGHHHVLDVAPSSNQARILAQALSADKGKLLIAQRQIRQWGFDFPSNQPNVIVYDPQREALRASLSLSSRAGPSILERLRRRHF